MASRPAGHPAPALDAQETALPDAALGQWMLGFASFIALCYYGRMLWLSFIPKNGYVTKPEIREFRTEIQEFRTYVRDSLHGIREDVQKLVVSVAVLEERGKP